MKKLLIAVTLILTTLPLTLNAAVEIDRNFKSELVRVGSVSATNGTIDELIHKIEEKTERAGANYYRITSMNTNNVGYATATLYNHANN